MELKVREVQAAKEHDPTDRVTGALFHLHPSVLLEHPDDPETKAWDERHR